MAYRGVIFDLDGTLLNTLDDLADAVNAVLVQHHLPPHPTEAFRYFIGDGVRMLVHRALPEDRRGEELVSECIAEVREVYGRMWNQKTQPYPGIPELLEALALREVKCAVLSNKPDPLTRKCVATLLPQGRFACVYGERSGVARKPDPAGAIAVLQELALPPGEVLYLGDSAVDMQTANAAGLFAVGALWGFRDATELRAHGARVLIERPSELLSLFGSV